MFGPCENGQRAIPSFIRALDRGVRPVIHGDGTDLRDYVHVADVAAAHVNACVRSFAAVANVGSGTGRATMDVLNAVAGAMGRPAGADFEQRPRAPSRLVVRISKRAASHFCRPMVSLADLPKSSGWRYIPRSSPVFALSTRTRLVFA